MIKTISPQELLKIAKEALTADAIRLYDFCMEQLHNAAQKGYHGIEVNLRQQVKCYFNEYVIVNFLTEEYKKLGYWISYNNKTNILTIALNLNCHTKIVE
jgi:hypothetical protein